MTTTVATAVVTKTIFWFLLNQQFFQIYSNFDSVAQKANLCITAAVLLLLLFFLPNYQSHRVAEV